MSFRTIDGRRVVIRPPGKEDFDELLLFINKLVDEDAPILVDKKLTRKGEMAWLKDELHAMKSGQKVALVAEIEGHVVAHGEVERHRHRENHVGTLGISVSEGFRDLGIGKLLMSSLLERAKMMGLRLVVLEVFDGNVRAFHLYEKFGFERVGTIPGKVMFRGEFTDVIQMVRRI